MDWFLYERHAPGRPRIGCPGRGRLSLLSKMFKMSEDVQGAAEGMPLRIDIGA